MTPRRARRPPHRQLAVDRTRWSNILWQGRHEASDTLAEQTTGIANEWTVATAGGGGSPAMTEDALDAAGAFGGEVFARLYEDAPMLDQPADPVHGGWACTVHDILGDLPEFQALRAGVVGDPDMAALATATLLQAARERLPDILKAAEEAEREAATGEHPTATGLPTARDQARAALRAAAREAQAVTDDARTGLYGLAPGLGHVPPQVEQETTARFQLAQRVVQDERLRQVLERAGRLARIAQQRKKQHSVHAREEVVDIERGNDLARVLPSQLAGLRHPTLRLLVLKGFAERGLAQYRLEGTETLGRGPIVVLLDESGSMAGDPHDWARAVGIACLGVGARERRQVVVVGFDAGVRSVVALNADGTAMSRDSDGDEVAPMGGVAEAALHVAQQNASGGTVFDRVLGTVLGWGHVLQDRADLVFVTDGRSEEVSPVVTAQLAEAKERGLRIWGCTVNGGSVQPIMQALCTAVVDIDGEQDKDHAVAGVIP